ncbi:hypothetical protein DDB_G0294272 [Dictyostelium discoideum AX4]|uniref:Uncharacterized protein n=1 Tax=Dictyostelium discoideum TaxID=44689 RepID=Q54AR0_DICDI|nr:hypothetical protein DDB_G0294272 [Dictyostelium discoideum AX4]EAL60347.1 hypothetical protein DDB_G0294272 [Dictyostelium discoideum AX4]|eukprot:XP_628760.1 hypothetical protein DDB_G0294272 [Dictyostelium discoideum AX4]
MRQQRLKEPASQTRPLEEVEREQQALEAKLQQLLNDFRTKKTQLEQAQNLAQKAQADLGQEIAQEKAKQEQLEAIEKELKERIEEGKVLNEQEQEA